MDLVIVVLLLSSCVGSLGVNESPEKRDFYSYEVEDITEENTSLEKYRGKVSLVVNVASQCGFTDSHYAALTKLQDIYGYTGFNVLAFPSNDFSEQEPGTNEEIYQFATETYAVEFPIFAKISVSGPDAHPAWKNLAIQSGKPPEWNFYKYLVDHNGKVLNVWGPRTSVEQTVEHIEKAIEKAKQAALSAEKGEKQQTVKKQSSSTEKLKGEVESEETYSAEEVEEDEVERDEL
ncbi:unnamed protein product [Cyprideis torosa]|uniref:Glutathione peroxidase n=1 Tax=Cyprideis torosa TaxID=163714 RepID=A0A7R8ZJV0_9CRUS|nr:unnamed protein product [Cyprideis torosa]CAG0878955.1 unnamed protein product [Cyprideis torosa]